MKKLFTLLASVASLLAISCEGGFDLSGILGDYVGPIIDELAEEYGDQVVIGKCDVDSCDDIVAQYRVRNIPTIVFIKGGEVVDKQVGACTKVALEEKLKNIL